MTTIIKLSLIALSAGAALAGGAQAEEVRISVIGKAPKAIHAEFVLAARKLCAGENTQPTYGFESDRDACVRDTVAKADGEYRQMKSLQLAMARGE